MDAVKAIPTQVEGKDLCFVKHVVRWFGICHINCSEPWDIYPKTWWSTGLMGGKKTKRKYGAGLSFQSHWGPFSCLQLFVLLVNLLISEPSKAHRGICCCVSARVPRKTSCVLRSTVTV